MYIPLKVTTDYSLLKSTIKIDDLITFLIEHQISAASICDEYLYGVMEFYDKCLKNNIKPIIGLEMTINEFSVYLYAKNYQGYQNLLKLNTIKTERELNFDDIKNYIENLLIILPFSSISLYDELYKVNADTYLGYQNEQEKIAGLLKTTQIVFINDIHSLKKEDTKYLDYLKMIREDEKIDHFSSSNYENNYYLENISQEDIETTKKIADLLNVEIPKNENYIPLYNNEIKDSYAYLENLTKKGLNKRLKGTISEEYESRLNYELSVIKKMGFVDYILIVYDYVLYAKKNNILVGPGRGSAAGSLVCYTLGITDIDPIKYHLLFERFLNPERITMPDIDIDFENTKRIQVIEYIKSRYGNDKVASIMTFATLKSKLVLREVARILNGTDQNFDKMIKKINAHLDLKENVKNNEIKEILEKNPNLKKIYKIALHLEGLKKNISTHAAGVVISKYKLDDLIPIMKIGENTLTGVTMEYLEELGLLKMDLLAIKNLTIIANIIELIRKDTGKTLNLNQINLDDKAVLDLFTRADTTGIFQFESSGMRSFLQKLKPRNFNDLVASLALYRPGPMDNISTYIKRKEGKEKIEYLDPSLKPILEETEGIIVYQEQVMQILVLAGNYTFAEADIIRRAMSKKKKEVLIKEQEKFVTRAIKNGYKKEVAEEIYELILKFAGYGFNKSHSVAYALIGYQMAYLKVKFPKFFITNLLNMSIGSEVKSSEYLLEAKKHNIIIKKPQINESGREYLFKNNELILPFSIIKGLSALTIDSMIKERDKGIFIDFIDFVTRMYNQNCNEHILETLIHALVFEEFGNVSTLLTNLKAVLNYAELASGVEEPLFARPILKIVEEENNLNQLEFNSYGFYISNHPASKYTSINIQKLKDITLYFDKYIRTVVMIEKITSTKTKQMQEMAFLDASDETGLATFVVFSKQIRLLDDLKTKDIVEIQGRVTKRFDKFQINVNNIIKK